MNKLNRFTTSILFAFFATQTNIAMADNTILHLKSPAIAGSGCLAGTTHHTLGANGKTLSVSLNYVADKVDKSCNIALPVQVPNGFQVGFSSAEFRGFVKGKAQLKRSYFFAGQSGRLKVSHLSSKAGRHYQVRDNLSHSVWSQCGEDVTMRINSRIKANDSESYIRVGSSGRKKGIIVTLRYRRCH
jgi:hypothetical protein